MRKSLFKLLSGAMACMLFAGTFDTECAAKKAAVDTRPILFICAGTSSMQGYAEPIKVGSISVEEAYWWDNSSQTWKTPVCDPLDSRGLGSPIPAIARHLKNSYPHRKLLFINGGVGGSTVADEDYRYKAGNWSRLGQLRYMLAQRVSLGLKKLDVNDVVFGGVIWWGGSNDAGKIANGAVTVASYQKSFDNLLEFFHLIYGCDIYCVKFARPSRMAANPALWKAFAELRDAQSATVARKPWAYYAFDASPYDTEADAWTGQGGTHLGQKATNIIGEGVGIYIAKNKNFLHIIETNELH